MEDDNAIRNDRGRKRRYWPARLDEILQLPVLVVVCITILPIVAQEGGIRFGRVAKTLNPEGNASLMTYDNAHNVTEQKGESADATVLAHSLFQYDGLKRPISQTMKHSFQGTDLSDVLESVTYDAASNLKTMTDPRSYSNTRGYDAAERLIQEVDPRGNVADLDYDASSNVTLVTETDLHPGGSTFVTTVHRYDALDRLKETEESDGRIWRRDYDARHQLISTADPEGNLTTYGYDGLNRRVRETRGRRGGDLRLRQELAPHYLPRRVGPGDAVRI